MRQGDYEIKRTVQAIGLTAAVSNLVASLGHHGRIALGHTHDTLILAIADEVEKKKGKEMSSCFKDPCWAALEAISGGRWHVPD